MVGVTVMAWILLGGKPISADRMYVSLRGRLVCYDRDGYPTTKFYARIDLKEEDPWITGGDEKVAYVYLIFSLKHVGRI